MFYFDSKDFLAATTLWVTDQP